MKNSLSTRITAIIFLLAFFLTLFGAGTITGASDSSLHRAGGYPEQQNLVDCRLQTNRSTPTRQVMQVINNEIHIWNEYLDPFKQYKCFYLLEPYQKALTAGEAAKLLAASKKWEQQALSLPLPEAKRSPRHRNSIFVNHEGVYSNSTVYPANKTDNNLVLQQEGMEDHRTPVDNKYSLTFPYNTIGFLNVDFPNNYMRSTAFLVGPNLALTNAHNIYSPEIGGWYKRIDFSLAQYEKDGPQTIKPYSSRTPVHVETNEKFYHYENEGDRDMAVQYDYAALFFEETFSEINTYMPIEFSHIPDRVAVIGYPGYVRDIKTNGLWKSEGSLIDYNEYCLYYDAYTSGGNSGSPVIVHREQADTYRIVAIHAFASPGYFSGGPHFNEKNQPIIEKWLRTASEHINSSMTSISLNKDSLSMIKGEQEALVVTTTPEHLSEVKFTWSSSNPDIAEVSADGIITALKEGQTLITVSTKNGSLKTGCKVIVEAAPEQESSEEKQPEEEVVEVDLGDLNGDQVINVLDVILLLQHLLEINELDAETRQKADVNADGHIDILDATLIMQYALGIIDQF